MRIQTYAPSLLWTLLLVIGSLQPHRLRMLSYGHVLHQVVHVLAFGLLGSLVILATSRRFRLWGVVACAALGLLIEYVQSYLYGAPLEWRDVWEDAVGVVVFSWIAVIAFDRHGAPHRDDGSVIQTTSLSSLTTRVP